MVSRGVAYIFGAAVAVTLFRGCTAQAPRDRANLGAGGGTAAGGSSGEGHSAHGEQPLACLSSFIVEKCGSSGCHDEQTQTYGMDLSTGASIFASWVNRDGLDNCEGKLVPRVVPGQPDASFVFRKITSQLACVGSISQPMPPPPAAALSPAEIEVIRGWIAAGAPEHCTSGEPISSGGAPSLGGTATTSDGGAPSGNGAAAAMGGASDDSGLFKCTEATPCTSQLICHANDCSIDVWDCVTHRPLPADTQDSSLPSGYRPHHPCPPETMSFCGCDGVTFVAPVTCPDRPYQHAGACDDGYDCNPNHNLCGLAPPSCEPDAAPSIVDECYASCVPASDCRCEFNWECPVGWQCDRTQWRCIVAPTPEGM